MITVSAEQSVRRLTPADAAAFPAIRLAGLAEEPRAFSADWGEESQNDLGWFADRLRMSAVFGIDDGENGLAAVIGLAIPTNPKQRHKGHVWGVYVRPAARGRVESLHLGVGTYNLAAIRVYGAAGFVGTGHEARALRIGDDFIDEITMTLDLR